MCAAMNNSICELDAQECNFLNFPSLPSLPPLSPNFLTSHTHSYPSKCAVDMDAYISKSETLGS